MTYSAEPMEGQERVGRPCWYVVQVASGCEQKVKSTLEQRSRALDMTDRILQVAIPQAPVVRIRKDGSRQNTEEKIYPGYVYVQMLAVQNDKGQWEIDDEAWQVVRSTPHVINFVGSPQVRGGRVQVKPMPLSDAEVERVFRSVAVEEPKVKVDMAPGDRIVVISGPFKDFRGEVIEVSPERSKLKALLSIFGRETPVELEFTQIQKES
ncbi:MAG: transcription termination/antitermination protein NusG [Gloeomargarita sp. SKYBB_i_bin120]|nr:transcription termination/antitermination protein NusG [Gloeomargarita sp. SKYG98]MCS7293593.1 transcription termination/antitermination protein NusG [Gloeomargarita sp. SKYB120]MDW8179159.1 transcription termination/antitermination protein NusG [Gloeomargarita sp. SKYBB_i_bin120]